MHNILKWSGIFFAVILVGLGAVWIFTTFVLDPKAERESTRGNPKTGLARVAQLNKQLSENTYPKLNAIIKENKNDMGKMKEQITIAYRGLPAMETKPAHGTIIENNTSGPIGGILVIDTTNTPDFDTLVTLTGSGTDKFGNRWKIIAMIQGGKTLEIPVTKGEYSLEFSSGVAWFGLQHLFGPLTDRLGCDGIYPFDEKRPGYQMTTYPKAGADFQVEGIKLKSIPRRDRAVQERIAELNAGTKK